MRSSIRSIFAAAAVIAIATVTASAADVSRPRYAAPTYVAPFNWSGFYVGGDVGYGWGRANSTAYLGGAPVGSASGSSSGFAGGVLAGYNWQGNSPFVLGIEGDLGIAKDTPWMTSVRGRMGYAFDRWLPYVTGGAAWVRINFNPPGASWTETRIGWTAGGGIEYAFNRNWRAGVEYRHTDFGTHDTNAFDPVVVKTKLTSDGVFGRLVYAF